MFARLYPKSDDARFLDAQDVARRVSAHFSSSSIDWDEATRLLQEKLERLEAAPAPIISGHKNHSSLALRAAMNEVIAVWHNNLRFASEKRLRVHLKHIGRLTGLKGDPLKKTSRELQSAAQTIIDRGMALWTSSNA
jgi:hypothetical protein